MPMNRPFSSRIRSSRIVWRILLLGLSDWSVDELFVGWEVSIANFLLGEVGRMQLLGRHFGRLALLFSELLLLGRFGFDDFFANPAARRGVKAAAQIRV